MRKAPAGMVDISDKAVTSLCRCRVSTIRLGKQAFSILMSQGSPKGDVFETARVAGIMAAKGTSQIIPLCHPCLNKVNITFENEKKLYDNTHRRGEIRGKTGVEMEALTAVSVAALTIYDMMKWADKGMVILDIKLLENGEARAGILNRSSYLILKQIIRIASSKM